ncbi:MAG: NADH-quinone oxidoreductase subunit L [Planctomycetaceae bacterium]|nr:NADH-quinone oxidoreductase subunit L [Planctomycetaceae bacterium]
MDTSLLPILLGIAVLLPLISFFVILAVGRWWRPVLGGYLATAAIMAAGLLSLTSLAIWLSHHPVGAAGHHAADQAGPYVGDYYVLGQFGALRITIGYYIDSLTIVMCCLITLIATCIHVYALGYMHEELHPVTDHEVTLPDGSPLRRPGRFSNFFQYMSLFCFSMLGLVLAGNVAMVFVFWELVGICSYFLIGFYVERKSASNAANKAFIVNRIGDFGMLVGMMALWGGMGTFAFGDADLNGNGSIERSERGLFSLVRPAAREHQLTTPEGLVLADAHEELQRWALAHPTATRGDFESYVAGELDDLRDGGPDGSGRRYGYWLLVLAGIGIFCGCVGKSAQFPLHVWLPDAMEGPTPVSALVHSATMVAAGVYLVGRFYPVFAPEVLLVIAVTGGITLFLAATIALTATDIKRVLAYSTVSQLGYMMLALGVGGWLAGMLHLVTHAFFKSLLFLCSGSVIHALHSNEMTVMGGLRKKMPITAATMLVGCLAITGLSIPFVIGLSGYYSKDMILEQAFSFARENPGLLGDGFFIVAAGGAAMTAFYMFRLWFLTFAGEPRDAQRYAHAHESPRVMYVPLIILAVFAAGVAWPAPFGWPSLQGLLEQARPAGTAVTAVSAHVPFVWPSEYIAHDAANYWSIVVPVTWLAFLMAVAGLLVAVAMYVTGQLSAREVSRQFAPLHRFLLHKWWFDELYDLLFVRPLYVVAGWCAAIDRRWIDGLIDHSARWTARLAAWSQWLGDHTLIDGFVDRLAAWTYRVGVSLRSLQTGSLRQYVLFLVIGVVAVFLISSFL